jgi:CubicO group peptidase (beta-lactamase class C family)
MSVQIPFIQIKPRKIEDRPLDNQSCEPKSSHMVYRRTFMLSSCAALFAPHVVRAQSTSFDDVFARFPQMRTLQIQSGDALVFAGAAQAGGLQQFANIKSVSKTIVALMLGTTFDRGEIASINATIGEVAPRLLPSNATPGAADITMQDLVTLRAGLERTSGANYGGWVNSPNWVADALSRPFVDAPGGRMLYSTGSTHILGAILSEVTGKSLLELTRERLGGPLGIEIPPWTRDPQGYYMGGNQMALRPRAMLKVATLIRDNGMFDGTQVVSGNWMLASTQEYTASNWSGLGYGYGVFLSPSGFVIARGYGGQIVAAHPERRLAIAITSDPTLPARSNGYFGELMELLDGPILAVS